MLRLRVISSIYAESQALELLASSRRDVYKLFRTGRHASSASSAGAASQTVLSSDGGQSAAPATANSDASVVRGAASRPRPPPPAPRRAWTLAASALAATASLGGVYLYRKLSEEHAPPAAPPPPPPPDEEPSVLEPASGAAFPAHVDFLLVGGGTASFAAMRALRSARPDALVLMVCAEPHPPYMRPPLSKEVWREPGLARASPADLHALSFRQWNGKRRALAYEPLAFYTPVAQLSGAAGAGAGAAAAARGWRVARLHVERREAELRAPGLEPVVVSYGECLVATGSRPRRLEALRGARAAGRVFALRGAHDAVRLARAIEGAGQGARVALVGGGFLASELSAALAGRGDVEVVQLFREEAPLARVLPPYLAAEAARRLREAGVCVMPLAEVVGSAADGADGAVLTLRDGRTVHAAAVVECVGAEPELEAALASGLERDPERGGVVVSAELQARAGVWAAGDVACFYDVALGRRRVEHHDHAVVSGRLAGENMAGVRPPRPYHHQSMFWSDLGPDLGYEAIGIIDSRLPTVGVFSAAAVVEAPASHAAAVGVEGVAPAAVTSASSGEARRYERGVVFYTREKRVVGVLLWNLFNRMHVARQVLAQGEFDDLFEVAKLFALHEDD